MDQDEPAPVPVAQAVPPPTWTQATPGTPTAMPAAAPLAPVRLPTSTLLMGGGAVALVLGAFLPWVTVASIFNLSGVSVRYGIGTLVAGLLVLVVAFGRDRVYDASKQRPLRIGAVVLGVAALGVALYVGFAIRNSLAQDKEGGSASGFSADTTSGDPEFQKSVDDFGKQIANAFAPKTGFGVYVTALGGLLVVVGAAQALRAEE